MTAMIDSNVIIGVWIGNLPARQLLQQAIAREALSISPIVFTELFAHPGMTEDALIEFISQTNISVAAISHEVFALAGKKFAAFAERRRKALGGGPRRIAADFIIGAHAVHTSTMLLTLDDTFFRRNFPELRLMKM